jgi:hypothetical protein
MDIINLIVGFAGQYPIIATLLMVIGALRVVFKPIFSVLRAYVEFTPNPADNLALDSVEGSKVYKGIVWFLDFFASVKISK